jgi:hypothetical protein
VQERREEKSGLYQSRMSNFYLPIKMYLYVVEMGYLSINWTSIPVFYCHIEVLVPGQDIER